MQLSLPYGTTEELVSLPEDLLIERIGRTAGHELDLAAILPNGIAHPSDSAPFEEFTGGNR